MVHEVLLRMSMKTIGGKALEKALRPAEPKNRLPAWAIQAGFRSYTMMSNDVLEAMYAPGQPTRQRVLAWVVRHSSGNNSEFCVLIGIDLQRSVAWRIDIAQDLELAESVVTENIQDIEEEGWIKTEEKGKRIYLISQPVIVVRKTIEQLIRDLPVPKVEEWCKTHSRGAWDRYEAARKEWNDARCVWREATRPYFEMVEKLAAAAPPAEGTPQNFVDQNKVKNGPRKKASLTTDPILIGTDSQTLKLASSVNPEEKPSQIGDFQRLQTAIGAMRQAHGLSGYLAFPPPDTILNMLRHGTAEEVASFLAQNFRERREPWKNWGGAMHALSHDLPTFRQDRAARIARMAPRPPVSDLTPQQAEECNLESAVMMLREMPEHEQAPEWRDTIERAAPELVEKIRARVAGREGL